MQAHPDNKFISMSCSDKAGSFASSTHLLPFCRTPQLQIAR
jgi:hypothetical protein